MQFFQHQFRTLHIVAELRSRKEHVIGRGLLSNRPDETMIVIQATEIERQCEWSTYEISSSHDDLIRRLLARVNSWDAPVRNLM